MIPYTVFVVDDDIGTRKALARLLTGAGFTVLTFASAEEFLQRNDDGTAGCLLLDLAMPGLSGLELQERLLEVGDHRFIIFLSGQGSIPVTVQAMKSGAVDFLTKPVDGRALLRAVHVAIDRDSQARVVHEELHVIRDRFRKLTPREREVLQHVVSGQLNKQIAADLGTCEQTIKVHRARVMEKMAARSLPDLVRFAERVGIAPVLGASVDQTLACSTSSAGALHQGPISSLAFQSHNASNGRATLVHYRG